MIGQNEATSGGSTSGVNFRRISTIQLQVFWTRLGRDVCIRHRAWLKGYFLRKDMPPAGVFLLMLVDWAEEPECGSQKNAPKDNHACCNAGDWNSHSTEHHTSQASHSKRIMRIVEARQGRRGEHHELHWHPAGPGRPAS